MNCSIRKIVVFIFLFSVLSVSFSSGFQSINSTEKNRLTNDQIIFLVSDEHPASSLISSPLACWYEDADNALHPFLIVHNKKLTDNQLDFISMYNTNAAIFSIGFTPDNVDADKSFLGSPSSISYQLAKQFFEYSDQVLLLPVDIQSKSYTHNLMATPLASYNHMPVLLYDPLHQEYSELRQTLELLQVSTIYLVGSTIHLCSQINNDYEIVSMNDEQKIQETVLSSIKQRFNSINYLTITNPKDVVESELLEEKYESTQLPVQHTSLFLLGKKIMLSGVDTVTKQITVPSGLHKYEITVSMKNTTSIFHQSTSVPVFLSATLKNPNGRTIAYGHSPGYQRNATYIETLVTNHSGNYTLTISLFYGYRGGYFSLRGLSNVQTILQIDEHVETRNMPHYPLVSGLSKNAAYLTSAHGGIIVADDQFSLFDETYAEIADQHSTGPWYDETLQEYNNEKVRYVLSRIEDHLSYIESFDLLDGFMNGPGWIALLGDTNMIPMYYYPSNQTHLAERGLPSDNPYSFDHQLSPGRILSYTASDASLLIARTLFYEQLCGSPSTEDEWHRNFNFVFGEGFGETGGLFHQIPYANTIESYGFQTTVYGDFRNSKQAAERLEVYTNTNFVEYLGHGDWFWYTPSIYGFNSVGQSIGSDTVRSWTIQRPNVVLTSACLMGRVDGVPPKMSIALSFLHAGSNAFIGATRETGQEAGLTVLEDHLIIDDYSLGEALRGEKQVDTIGPTYYVRCLFGDPAFNPYDPLHGFSNQGRP